MSETKKCPFCGEEINSNAIKCKHCHEWLNNENIDNGENNDEKDSKKSFKVFYSFFASILALIAGILMLIESYNPGFIDNINQSLKFNNKSSSNKPMNDTDNLKENIPDTITKSDYIGEWEEVTAGRIYINIEDKGNYIKVTHSGSNSAYSSSESIYTCHYNDKTSDLVCNGAKNVDTFASCNGFSSEYNMDEYSKCEEETPELVKEDSKTYSDNEERILSIKKGDKNHYIVDEIEYMGEEDKLDVRKNYKNMGLYFKKGAYDSDEYFFKQNN